MGIFLANWRFQLCLELRHASFSVIWLWKLKFFKNPDWHIQLAYRGFWQCQNLQGKLPEKLRMHFIKHVKSKLGVSFPIMEKNIFPKKWVLGKSSVIYMPTCQFKANFELFPCIFFHEIWLFLGILSQNCIFGSFQTNFGLVSWKIS